MAPPFELAAPERPTTVARLRRAPRPAAGRAASPSTGVELTGHPTDRLPGHLSLIVRGVDGAAIVVALDLEGIATSTGSACTTGSTEVQPRAGGHGLPRRRGSRGAAPVPRPDDDATPRSTQRGRRVVPAGRSARWPPLGRRSRLAARPRAASRRGRRDEPDPRGDVRRRRFAPWPRRCSTSRAPRSSGSGCACTTSPTAYSEFKKSCCSLDAAEDARRVAGQLGIPFYVMNLEREFGGRRAGAVPRRLPRRPDAEPVRRLQHARQVRRAAGPGPPPLRLRRGGHRALRPPRRRRPDGRGRALLPGRGRGQGPDLLPVRPAPGPAGAQPLPARRADQARGARRRARPRPRHRRQAREPGDLLRARRRLPRCAARRAAAGRRSRARCSTRTARGWASTPARPGYTVGQRQGLGVALGEPRYVSPRSTRRPTRSCSAGARTSRRDTIELEGVTFIAEAPPPARAGRLWLPFRAQVRIRHRARSSTRRSARPSDEPARGGRWVVETESPVWAIAPGQACVLYDGDALPRRRPDRGPGPAAVDAGAGPRRGSGPGVTIPPGAAPRAARRAPPHVALRPHPRRRRRPAAAALRRRDPRGVGRAPRSAAGSGSTSSRSATSRSSRPRSSPGSGIGIVAILATLGPQARKA